MEPRPPDRLSEIEQLLLQLTPEPLATSRDEFFFRAGQRATRSQWGHKLWPAATAALVVVSCGLGLALQRQTSELQTLLAAQATPRAEAIVKHETSSPPLEVAPNPQAPKTNLTADEQKSPFIDDLYAFHGRQFSSPDSFAPGRLTARGWIAAPWTEDEVRKAAAPAEHNDESMLQRFPRYLDQVRSQQKG